VEEMADLNSDGGLLHHPPSKKKKKKGRERRKKICLNMHIVIYITITRQPLLHPPGPDVTM
jgi:hypothetical protein